MFLKVEGNTSKGAIFIYNYSNSERAEIRITEFFPDREFDIRFTQSENL